MTTETVHDTSRVDAWLAAQRERESAQSKAAVYQARGDSYRQLWKPMAAGAAGAAMVVAAVWVAMPKFVPREIEIPVLNVITKDVEVPHIVTREVRIDAPNVVRHDFPVENPNIASRDAMIEAPSAGDPTAIPDTAALPPKTPTAAERDFINRPEYQSADLHGRIVGPSENGFMFDNGRAMSPAKIENGKIVDDLRFRHEVEPLIGDYAFCNRGKIKNQFHCFVIHDGVVQDIPRVPITPKESGTSQPQKATDASTGTPPSSARSSTQVPEARKKIRN